MTDNETFIWQAPGAWRKPCIVHVTMVAKGRQAIFGSLVHNGEHADVEKTSIGWALINEQQRLLQLCPEIRVLADKVMPDHYHLILRVCATMPRSIKEAVRGYMQGCRAAAEKAGWSGPLFDGPPFFRVLTHKGQLDAMIRYVLANAERAWIRRQQPDLFRLRRDVEVMGRYNLPERDGQEGGSAEVPKSGAGLVSSAGIESPHPLPHPLPLRFSLMGNHWLLSWPMKQWVEVSRSATEEQIADIEQDALAMAERGAVIVTAAVSAGEKRVARRVREAGYPLVVLMVDGFPVAGSEHERYYKPGGVYFEACSRGRLLLMEPAEDSLNHPMVRECAENILREKAELRQRSYVSLPAGSLRYRFMACNVIGRMLASGEPSAV